MRYTIAQLVARANAGNVGRRGLHRLEQAGLNPDELAASGAQSPLNVNPDAELAARRQQLYGHALAAAQTASQTGGTLSEGLQRRLALGEGGPGPHFAPSSADQVKQFGEDNVNTILDALRKRRGDLVSTSAIYRGGY